MSRLEKVSLIQGRVAGFASINYRLSSYPEHPTNPSSEDDTSRNARHPDHLLDVSTALAFLDGKYNINNKYLLVGHSCGATLAFQLREHFMDITVPRPYGILGVDGIYALKELSYRYANNKAYMAFIKSAFGWPRKLWTEASPYEAKEGAIWETVDTAILAHSPDDELLDESQTAFMRERMEETPAPPGFRRSDRFISAKGKHDEIWRHGEELGRLIVVAMVSMNVFP